MDNGLRSLKIDRDLAQNGFEWKIAINKTCLTYASVENRCLKCKQQWCLMKQLKVRVYEFINNNLSKR